MGLKSLFCQLKRTCSCYGTQQLRIKCCQPELDLGSGICIINKQKELALRKRRTLGLRFGEDGNRVLRSENAGYIALTPLHFSGMAVNNKLRSLNTWICVIIAGWAKWAEPPRSPFSLREDFYIQEETALGITCKLVISWAVSSWI